MSHAPTPALRLIRPDDRPMDVLPFERRQGDRRGLKGRVTGIVRGPEKQDMKVKVCGLTLCDLSATGLGVCSQEPIATGTRLSVFMPPHGHDRGQDLSGQVVRCHKTAAGYIIGVQLEQAITSRSA